MIDAAQIIKDIATDRVNRVEWTTNERYYQALILRLRDECPVDDPFFRECNVPLYAHTALGLMNIIRTLDVEIRNLADDYQRFAIEYQREPDPRRKVELALVYYKKMFGPMAKLKKARKAFTLYPDSETFVEWYRKQTETCNILQEKAFLLIGFLIADFLLENSEEPDRRTPALKRIYHDYGLEAQAFQAIKESAFDRTRLYAANMLAAIAEEAQSETKIHSFEGMQTLLALSQSTTESVWIKIAALRTIAALFYKQGMDLFRLHLFAPDKEADDSLFVRKWVVGFVSEFFRDAAGLKLLIDFWDEPEPSDYVRMAAATALGTFGWKKAGETLRTIALPGPRSDISPPVRAKAVEAMVHGAIVDGHESSLRQCAKTLAEFIQRESNPFAQRVCLEGMTALVRRPGRKSRATDADALVLDAVYRAVKSTRLSPKVRYWAAMYKETMVMILDPVLARRMQQVKTWLAGMTSNQTRILPKEASELEMDLLGRLLAHCGLRDFGYYIRRDKGRLILRKGEPFRFQLWRLYFELANPSPDKRRNYRHTKGRYFRGMIRAHSDVLGELTTTKVPGEPLVIWEYGNWRRHIPLVDDCLSLLRPFNHEPEIRLFSSAGVTSLKAPDKKGRFAKYLKMVFDYSRLARLRNSHPGNKQSPDIGKYIKALREEYGIKITFTPYIDFVEGATYRALDPSMIEAFGRDGCKS